MKIKIDDKLIEQIGKESFSEVSKNLKNIYGELTPEEIKESYKLDRESVKKMEQGHEAELEQLAINLIKEQFEIGDEINFDVKLVDVLTIDGAGKQKKINTNTPVDDCPNEDLEFEISKRRIVNSMIAGSARKHQFLFHFGDFPKEQAEKYNKIMSYNDYIYWNLKEPKKKKNSGNKKVFGCCWIELKDKPTVYARAYIFPVLLHEIAKGVMELMSLWGLPEDRDTRNYVLHKADYLSAERWDLTHGGKIWQKFNEAIENKYLHLRQHLYTEVIKLPAREFHAFMTDLMSNSPKVKEWLSTKAREVSMNLINQESEEEAGSGSIADLL